jgi:predicted nucleic acid-binding protein
MGVSYLLDSTVLIDHGNGFAPGIELVTHLFGQAATLYTCDVVTCEVLSRGGPDAVASMLSLLDALEYVALDPDGARWAGTARREGRARSGARSLADALLGAVAWRLGATIVTRNPRDFERMGIPVLRYGAPLP